MLLWIIFAIITAVTAIAIVTPYQRYASKQLDREQDVAVYKQQLVELESEVERGVIETDEAAAAKVEISRRLLAASKQQKNDSNALSQPYIPYILIAFIAVSSMGTYLHFGSPQLPDLPLTSRAQPNKAPSIEDMVARVEERLKKNPEDGEGWSVVANVYMRMGRYNDAANAFRKVNELLGETPRRVTSIGEALALANNGVVSPEAAKEFKKALSLDPKDIRAQFWIAAKFEQNGDMNEAKDRYQKIIAQKPPAEVVQIIERRLADINGTAAASLTSNQKSVDLSQNEMVNQMVNGLAERLKEDGADLEGWIKLMRSYKVMGRMDDAIKALDQAKQNFKNKPEALVKIDNAAKTLGINQQQADLSQSAMIDQMVNGLAERLKEDGADLEGWLKLMRSYKVLGRKDDALKALDQARQNFKDKPDALAKIDETAKALGIKS